MIKVKRETHWLDFFPGGVPAGIIFDMQVEDVWNLVRDYLTLEGMQHRAGSELAFMGLIAYFEGFCKNHTASLLNVCPELVRELARTGADIKLRPIDILNHIDQLPTQFG